MAVNSQTKKIIKEIKGDKPIKTLDKKELSNPKKAFLKDAYLFSYPNPKTGPKELPYFDAQPIVVILARQGTQKILGLNLNHIPYTYALQIAKNLEKKAKNKKRAVKYEDVKRAIQQAKLPEVYYMVAIKSYILKRISGKVYTVGIADGEYRQALKDVPRKFKRKSLSTAIRSNQAKVAAYIRSKKTKKKK